MPGLPSVSFSFGSFTTATATAILFFRLSRSASLLLQYTSHSYLFAVSRSARHSFHAIHLCKQSSRVHISSQINALPLPLLRQQPLVQTLRSRSRNPSCQNCTHYRRISIQPLKTELSSIQPTSASALRRRHIISLLTLCTDCHGRRKRQQHLTGHRLRHKHDRTEHKKAKRTDTGDRRVRRFRPLVGHLDSIYTDHRSE